VREADGDMRVYFDQASMSEETKLSREREQWRELGRLLYVTLTRPRSRLIVPWAAGFGAGQRAVGVSFAELWGDDESWSRLPEIGETLEKMSAANAGEGATLRSEDARGLRELHALEMSNRERGDLTEVDGAPLPKRVLPHQLAEKMPDRVRGVRHEASSEESTPRRDGDEAIDYGLWWHETMEFMPWGDDESTVGKYLEESKRTAEALGFGARAELELSLLRASETWKELNDGRWTRLAELAVFAPLQTDAWMDGVIDFVLHDADAKTAWILDWKTNRRRAAEADDAMLERLLGEYRPQLTAYGVAARQFFPGHRIRLLIYASALGKWVEVAVP
jgi:ATP-dependent exoDNAse (exonuclease V) beta subunit